MRVLLCVKKDLLGCCVLNCLLRGLQRDDVGVVLSVRSRVGDDAPAELAALEFLEADLPNRLLFPVVERSIECTINRNVTFDEMRRGPSLTIIETTDLRDPETRKAIGRFAPELVISARFSFIFDECLIESVPLGIFNVHPGPLPEYAGLFPVFHQMLAGERRLGCTLHYVNRGIDSGDVIAVDWIPADCGRSMVWHLAELYRRGATRAVAVVDAIRCGASIRREAQNRTRRRYFRLPTEEEVRAFKRGGRKMWSVEDYVQLLSQFGLMRSVPEPVSSWNPGSAATPAKI